jgi:hypothetical protein
LNIWNVSNGKIIHRIEIASSQIIQDCFIGSYLIVVSIKQETNMCFIKGFELNLKVSILIIFKREIDENQ